MCAPVSLTTIQYKCHKNIETYKSRFALNSFEYIKSSVFYGFPYVEVIKIRSDFSTGSDSDFDFFVEGQIRKISTQILGYTVSPSY